MKKGCKRTLTAHSILNLLRMRSYSVPRLRSQLIKPTPMLPKRIAPGAGMTLPLTKDSLPPLLYP